MTRVQEIAVEYAARGAGAAQRADRRVRDSINETAQTARSEAGTIDRWMDRHETAIRRIGTATAGAMGAILAASPTFRAELAGVRLGFSLLADQIVRDVLPSAGSLSQLAVDLGMQYRDLDDDTRELMSATFLLAGAAGAVALAFGPTAGAIAGVIIGVGLLLDHFDLLDDAIDVGTAAFEMFSALLRGDVDEAWDIFSSGASTALSWLRDNGPSIASSAASGIRSALGRLGAWARETLWPEMNRAADRFLEWLLTEAPGLAADAMLRVADRMNEGIERFLEWLLFDAPGIALEGMARIGRWMLRGVWRAARWVWDATTDLASGIWDRLPSRSEMVDWGKDMIGGLASGIRDATVGRLESAAESAADTVRSYWPGSDADRGPLSDFTRIPETMTDTLTSFADDDRFARAGESTAGDLRPTPTAGGGDGSTTIIFEHVEVRGFDSPRQAADNFTRQVSDQLGGNLKRRGV